VRQLFFSKYVPIIDGSLITSKIIAWAVFGASDGASKPLKDLEISQLLTIGGQMSVPVTVR
jgi:hypothetical protein